MRNYHSPDPIILSVGEKEEVSIAEVAHHIAEAMDFKGIVFIIYIDVNIMYSLVVIVIVIIYQVCVVLKICY